MNGFLPRPQVSKPGDDLLFHRLSDSTIGAVWFHGRVRDGIGWVTDAMATKLWDLRKGSSRNRASYLVRQAPGLSLMVGFIKRE